METSTKRLIDPVRLYRRAVQKKADAWCLQVHRHHALLTLRFLDGVTTPQSPAAPPSSCKVAVRCSRSLKILPQNPVATEQPFADTGLLHCSEKRIPAIPVVADSLPGADPQSKFSHLRLSEWETTHLAAKVKLMMRKAKEDDGQFSFSVPWWGR